MAHLIREIADNIGLQPELSFTSSLQKKPGCKENDSGSCISDKQLCKGCYLASVRYIHVCRVRPTVEGVFYCSFVSIGHCFVPCQMKVFSSEERKPLTTTQTITLRQTLTTCLNVCITSQTTRKIDAWQTRKMFIQIGRDELNVHVGLFAGLTFRLPSSLLRHRLPRGWWWWLPPHRFSVWFKVLYRII